MGSSFGYWPPSSTIGCLPFVVVLRQRRVASGLLRRSVSLHEAIYYWLERGDEVALLRVRPQLHRHNAIHLEIVIVSASIQLRSQIVDKMRICHPGEFGRRIVLAELVEDLLGLVNEVQNVGRFFARMRAVEP